MFSGTSDGVIVRALGVLQLTSVMRKSLTALTAATAIAATAIATLTDYGDRPYYGYYAARY
jgi:hypothetical protein